MTDAASLFRITSNAEVMRYWISGPDADIHQTRHRFACINGVEQERIGARGETHRIQTRRRGNGIARANIAVEIFDIVGREANVRPEIIAIKLNRTVHAVKARAYVIGLPLKWFKLKAKGK